MKFIITLLLTLILFGSLQARGMSTTLPASVDSSAKYMFYLHGYIVEEYGLRPYSEKFGYYEYEAILDTLRSYDFNVISERRLPGTDRLEYAKKVNNQIDSLINIGVNPRNITVVGASRGAFITILISSLTKNENINFVVMAICNEEIVNILKKNNYQLWGRILYMVDEADDIAESCAGYIDELKSEGMKEFKEIILSLGLGHGILYQPYKEWVQPVVDWANFNK